MSRNISDLSRIITIRGRSTGTIPQTWGDTMSESQSSPGRRKEYRGDDDSDLIAATYEQVTRAPFDLDDELARRIEALALAQTVQDLETNGFGYIHDAADADFVERLGHAILCHDNEGFGGEGNKMLLDKEPEFTEAALNPKIRAIAEVMCGRGALFSQMLSSVMNAGDAYAPMHADQEWTPEPFPIHDQLVTFCWTIHELDEANGATKVVPGSHRRRRHPRVDEIQAEQGLVSTACPAGSIVVWGGSTWHGGGPRTAPGQRIMLHITFNRLALRPVENYSHLDDDWLKDKPYAARVMLGREDFLDSPDGAMGAGAETYFRTLRWARS